MTTNDQNGAEETFLPKAPQITADALPHLAILARLPLLPERGLELLPRINLIAAMVRMLDEVDVGQERPSSVFDPQWVDHASL